jgi:membrane protein
VETLGHEILKGHKALMAQTSEGEGSSRWGALAARTLLWVRTLRDAAIAALQHDALTVGQATAYSAMVALFPALIVTAAVVGLLPESLPLRVQLAVFFDRVLPSNVSPLLDSYFTTAHRNAHTARALLGALVVSLMGASSVMATLMEGFRRAYDLPLTAASFWPRRGRALVLVPLSLLPMTLASMLVVFGQVLTRWLVGEVTPALRMPVYVVAFVLRWSVTLAGSVGIIAVIYHLGTDLSKHMRQHLSELLKDPLLKAPQLREPLNLLQQDWTWRASLPGAAVATVLWFVTTLLFGFYVTRFANYSQVYGSLGAAIALMFWLYIIALSVLIGAEFNAQRASQGPGRRDPQLLELLRKLPGLQRLRTGRIAD